MKTFLFLLILFFSTSCNLFRANLKFEENYQSFKRQTSQQSFKLIQEKEIRLNSLTKGELLLQKGLYKNTVKYSFNFLDYLHYRLDIYGSNLNSLIYIIVKNEDQLSIFDFGNNKVIKFNPNLVDISNFLDLGLSLSENELLFFISGRIPSLDLNETKNTLYGNQNELFLEQSNLGVQRVYRFLENKDKVVLKDLTLLSKERNKLSIESQIKITNSKLEFRTLEDSLEIANLIHISNIRNNRFLEDRKSTFFTPRIPREWEVLVY